MREGRLLQLGHLSQRAVCVRAHLLFLKLSEVYNFQTWEFRIIGIPCTDTKYTADSKT